MLPVGSRQVEEARGRSGCWGSADGGYGDVQGVELRPSKKARAAKASVQPGRGSKGLLGEACCCGVERRCGCAPSHGRGARPGACGKCVEVKGVALTCTGSWKLGLRCWPWGVVPLPDGWVTVPGYGCRGARQGGQGKRWSDHNKAEVCLLHGREKGWRTWGVAVLVGRQYHGGGGCKFGEKIRFKD